MHLTTGQHLGIALTGCKERILSEKCNHNLQETIEWLDMSQLVFLYNNEEFLLHNYDPNNIIKRESRIIKLPFDAHFPNSFVTKVTMN